jgi:hypothetical protein
MKLCDDADAWVSAWVNVQAEGNVWSQVGYRQDTGHPIRYWAQTNTGPTEMPQNSYGPLGYFPEDGEEFLYTVVYVEACECLQNWAGLIKLSELPVEALTYRSISFFGETFKWSDTMDPGTPTDPADFSELGWQEFSTSTAFTTEPYLPTAYTQSNRYHFTDIEDNSFKIYTG